MIQDHDWVVRNRVRVDETRNAPQPVFDTMWLLLYVLMEILILIDPHWIL